MTLSPPNFLCRHLVHHLVKQRLLALVWIAAFPLLQLFGNDLPEGHNAPRDRSQWVKQSPPLDGPKNTHDLPDRPQRLVSNLDSPIFSQRRAAFQSLLRQGTSANHAISQQIKNAVVRHGLRHPSVEVRLAATDLLKRFRFHHMESQLNQLRDPRISSDSIDIDQWGSFSLRGGADMLSRNFFAKLYLQFPSLLRTPISVFHRDPAKLQRNDSTGWAMLIWMDLDANTRQWNSKNHASARYQIGVPNQPNGQKRLGLLLSQSARGPILDLKNHSVVLSRMIGAWINNTPTATSPNHQKLRIALRYNHIDLACGLIDQIFSDPHACPRSRIAALLAAHSINHQDTVRYAMTSLKDERNASGWTLVRPPNHRIRTQVRDVGLAVLLQTRGMDPRSAGFDYLEADPILVFKSQSLGFPDQASRQAAQGKGKNLLQHFRTAPE
ncbi:MAG: hypothetical protein VYA84_14125 [Planctomycetota bacterium]|nr:hypothetical protein [Planctomycetota bacterium]